ncbi:MAG: hypothetical protein WB973_04720 [Thermoanaerobaculia bacterium]
MIAVTLVLLSSSYTVAQSLDPAVPDLSALRRIAAASDPLTAAERELAIGIARDALTSEKLLPDVRTFLAAVVVFRDTRAEAANIFERHALVTYYRYAGDLGIRVDVNLVRRNVARLEKLPHFPVSLTAQEVARGAALALADARLKPMLEPFGAQLATDAILASTAGPKDPLFGHRLAHLLFRVGQRPLDVHAVVVADLTDEKVLIEHVPQGEMP